MPVTAAVRALRAAVPFVPHLYDYVVHGGMGQVVQGTPEEVAQAAGSHTGRYLREYLAAAK